MSGFFKHGEADALWKTMAGVSSQGKKRGRARNSLKKKNLNQGKRIGFGKAKINWPGLTSSVVTGAGRAGKKTEIGVIKEDVYQSYQEELAEITKKFNTGGRCTHEHSITGYVERTGFVQCSLMVLYSL